MQPDLISLFTYTNPLALQTPPHWISALTPVLLYLLNPFSRPALHNLSSATCHSYNPGGFARSFPLEQVISATRDQTMSVFPIKSKGQHPQLVNEANTDSLSLRPVASPLQNLQPSITRRLLCGTTEMNG